MYLKEHKWFTNLKKNQLWVPYIFNLNEFDHFNLCNNYLDDVNMAPFKPPNVEAATNMGIIHDAAPSMRSANVCN